MFGGVMWIEYLLGELRVVLGLLLVEAHVLQDKDLQPGHFASMRGKLLSHPKSVSMRSPNKLLSYSKPFPLGCGACLSVLQGSCLLVHLISNAVISLLHLHRGSSYVRARILSMLAVQLILAGAVQCPQ